MRRLMAALLLAAAAGCGDPDDSDSVVWVAVPASSDLTYLNGHPITYEAPFSDEELEMADLINAHRVANGEDALYLSVAMSEAARAHSVHMEIHDFIGRVNPEGDDADDRADLAGIFYYRYEEMTGDGTEDPREMFDEWIWSSSTDNLIHDPFMTHMGVGFHCDYWNGYWTVDFAER